MIDGSEKRNRQLAFELQNSHVCEKRSKISVNFEYYKNITRKHWDLMDILCEIKSGQIYRHFIGFMKCLLIITGVQASGVIIDRLLQQCCFVRSENCRTTLMNQCSSIK